MVYFHSQFQAIARNGEEVMEQEQDVSSHIPSVARKQRAVHGVLSFLSIFYAFQDLKPWQDTTHNQGESPYFK